MVIYCHCNSGSRRDAEEALHVLMPHGIHVVTLDFAVSMLYKTQSSDVLPISKPNGCMQMVSVLRLKSIAGVWEV